MTAEHPHPIPDQVLTPLSALEAENETWRGLVSLREARIYELERLVDQREALAVATKTFLALYDDYKWGTSESRGVLAEMRAALAGVPKEAAHEAG